MGSWTWNGSPGGQAGTPSLGLADMLGRTPVTAVGGTVTLRLCLGPSELPQFAYCKLALLGT